MQYEQRHERWTEEHFRIFADFVHPSNTHHTMPNDNNNQRYQSIIIKHKLNSRTTNRLTYLETLENIWTSLELKIHGHFKRHENKQNASIHASIYTFKRATLIGSTQTTVSQYSAFKYSTASILTHSYQPNEQHHLITHIICCLSRTLATKQMR